MIKNGTYKMTGPKGIEASFSLELVDGKQVIKPLNDEKGIIADIAASNMPLRRLFHMMHNAYYHFEKLS